MWVIESLAYEGTKYLLAEGTPPNLTGTKATTYWEYPAMWGYDEVLRFATEEEAMAFAEEEQCKEYAVRELTPNELVHLITGEPV